MLKERKIKVISIDALNLTIKDYVIKGPDELVRKQIDFIRSRCKRCMMTGKNELTVLWEES